MDVLGDEGGLKIDYARLESARLAIRDIILDTLIPTAVTESAPSLMYLIIL